MRRSKVFLAVVLCTLLACLAAPAQKRKYGTSKTPQTSQTPTTQAAKTPTTVVTPIDNEALKKLISQRQGPLLVNFWATFCDPCRDEFPDLVKIDKEYRPQSLEFITVSLDDMVDIKTGVPKFLEAMNATMPAYLLNVNDPEPSINLVDPRWRGDLPATFLFNEKGEVVYKHIGRVDPAELRNAIDKLVKKAD